MAEIERGNTRSMCAPNEGANEFLGLGSFVLSENLVGSILCRGGWFKKGLRRIETWLRRNWCRTDRELPSMLDCVSSPTAMTK